MQVSIIDINSIGDHASNLSLAERTRRTIILSRVDELADPDLPGELEGFFVEGKVKIAVDWTRTNNRLRSGQGG